MDLVTVPAICTSCPSYWLGSSRSFLIGVAPLQPAMLTSVAAARIHGASPRTACRADLIVPPCAVRRVAGLSPTAPPATSLSSPWYVWVHPGPNRTRTCPGSGTGHSLQDQV